MERVAFILIHSDERIGCLLNPESFVIRRWAGIQPRSSIGGAFASAELSDMPLLHTGLGLTELTFDLLFDVSLTGRTPSTDDIRDITAPFWELAETMAGTDGRQHPPHVRFVWGKSWNIPGVITDVAEKFDRFTGSGSPTRSWMRLRMLRVLDASPGQTAMKFRHRKVLIPEKREDASRDELQSHIVASHDRLDALAARYYGDASLWRVLAAYNEIDDPLHVATSAVLRILPKTFLETSE